MAPPSKPTIVIIPGAWHPASAMVLLLGTLRAQDRYAAVEAHIRGILRKHVVDAARDVVLVLHSYAGFPGTAAVARLGLGKGWEKGKGGVLDVVYMAAFVPAEGVSMMNIFGEPWERVLLWWWSELPDSPGLLHTHTHARAEVFYGCLPASSELVTSVAGSLQGHSRRAFETQPAAIGWRDPEYDGGRRDYVRCLRDAAIPVAAQNAMVARTQPAKWTLDTDHCPFLSKPEELATVL